MLKQPRHLFEFGRFRLDRTERFLFQDGAPVPLPPRVFDTLLILVENRGHVVEKDDLMQKIWTDVTVEENNLTQNISALRKILGDNPAGPKFIETIPKRGYRFVAAVKEVLEELSGAVASDRSAAALNSEKLTDDQSFITSFKGSELPGTGLPGESTLTAGRGRRSRQIARAIGLGIALAVLVGSAVAWYAWSRWGPGLQLKETQLTTNSSEASVAAAAISPDGKYLAYADGAALYVRVSETGETHSISVPPASVIGALSWFPDGTRLLATVTRLQPNVDSVWVLSILGQSPVKLLDGASQAAVSPDGSQIAFVRGGGNELWLMAANGESPHRILAAGEKENLAGPVWRWDGKHLAYGRVFSDVDKFDTKVETLDLETGKITASFSDPAITAGVALPGGRIVYSRNEVIAGQSGASLLALDADPDSGNAVGNPRQIARWTGSSISSLSATRDGKHLIILRGTAQADVYVGDIVEHRLENPHRLTFNDRDDFPSDWTPDGHDVLFASNRNGRMDIFKQALDQHTAEALITGPEDKLYLCLSPDGHWLMYFAFPGGYSPAKAPILMRVPFSGGPPQFVFKAGPASDFHCPRAPATLCALSEWENQQLVFYALDPVQGKGLELARQELASRPDIVESDWDISPDGSRIALAMPDGPPARIRILSLTGGALQDIRVSGWSAFQSMHWSADGKGWYVASRSASANTLLFVDRQGHAYPLSQTASGYDTYAVPSPDGHHLAFLEYTTANNAWMIENF